MLYCSLHLQRAAEKSTTQTRQEHQSTGNILTRYLEDMNFPYIWMEDPPFLSSAHFPVLAIYLTMLYCCLHLKRAAKKLMTRTRKELQIILNKYFDTLLLHLEVRLGRIGQLIIFLVLAAKQKYR